MGVCDHITDDLPEQAREADYLSKVMTKLRHVESIEDVAYAGQDNKGN